MTTPVIDVSFESDSLRLPSVARITQWAVEALGGSDSIVAIRVVDATEMIRLNSEFAAKPKATNVLSFPAMAMALMDSPDESWQIEWPLGDIAVCAPVVEAEAIAQGKALEAHWAHMIVHGILHLRGYDHVDEEGALQMEQCERDLLFRLGYPDPYRDPSSGCTDSAPGTEDGRKIPSADNPGGAYSRNAIANGVS